MVKLFLEKGLGTKAFNDLQSGYGFINRGDDLAKAILSQTRGALKGTRNPADNKSRKHDQYKYKQG